MAEVFCVLPSAALKRGLAFINARPREVLLTFTSFRNCGILRRIPAVFRLTIHASREDYLLPKK